MSIENNPISAIGNSLKSSWLQRVLFIICKQIFEDEETKVNGQFSLCAGDVCMVYNKPLIKHKCDTKFLEKALYGLQKYCLVFTRDDGVKIASPFLSRITRKEENFIIDFDMGMRRFFIDYFQDNNELNCIEYSSLRGKFSRRIYKLITRNFSDRFEMSFHALKEQLNLGSTRQIFRSDFSRRLLWAKKEIEKKTPLRFSWEYLTTKENQNRIVFTDIHYANTTNLSEDISSDIETDIVSGTGLPASKNAYSVSPENQDSQDISSSCHNNIKSAEIIPPLPGDFEDDVIEDNECPAFIKNTVQYDGEQSDFLEEQEADEEEEIDGIKFLRSLTATRESDQERYNELLTKYEASANKRIIGISDVCDVKPSLAFLEYNERCKYDNKNENLALQKEHQQCRIDHFQDLMSDCYGRCNKPEICKLCRDTKPTKEQAVEELKRRYLNNYAMVLLWQPEDVAEFLELGGEISQEMFENKTKLQLYDKSALQKLRDSAKKTIQEDKVA